MEMIKVVVGIILDSSKSNVLVAQRNTRDEHFGQWEFPGGKIDSGESVEGALKRELQEELGIIVTAIQSFENFEHQYKQRKVHLDFYLVTEFAGQAQSKEGQKIKWQGLDDLPKLAMLEANNKVIKRLVALKDSW